MSSASVWKLLILRMLRSPLVGLPIGLGVAAWASGAALGVGFFEFLGVSGVLFGIGAGLTRLVWDNTRVIEEAAHDLRNQLERDQLRSLDELERRFVGENAPDWRQSLDRLRVLGERLRNPETWAAQTDTELLPEIRQRAEQLYSTCLSSLERTSVLWRAAQKMLTSEGRQRVLESRAELIGELDQGLEQLGRTFDELYASAIERDRSGEELARIRHELDTGLEVAQRIEARMSQFEETLRNPESPLRE